VSNSIRKILRKRMTDRRYTFAILIAVYIVCSFWLAQYPFLARQIRMDATIVLLTITQTDVIDGPGHPFHLRSKG